MQLQIEEVAALLHIYEKASGHPQLVNIRNEVWAMLLQIDKEHAPMAPTQAESETQPEPLPVEDPPAKEPAHAA